MFRFIGQDGLQGGQPTGFGLAGQGIDEIYTEVVKTLPPGREVIACLAWSRYAGAPKIVIRHR